MKEVEIMFFNSAPRMLRVYEALREGALLAHPEMEIKVSRTQISFRERYIFAMASLPRRKIPGRQGEYLLVSFGLGYRIESPRVIQAVEPYPGRWTHHVPVWSESDIDAELMNWLDEANFFARHK